MFEFTVVASTNKLGGSMIEPSLFLAPLLSLCNKDEKESEEPPLDPSSLSLTKWVLFPL